MKIFLQRLLFSVFVCLCYHGFCQKSAGIIKGKIIAADGNPAVYVTVELKKLHRIAITDENGIFILSHLPAFQDSLIISSVESEIFYQPVNLNYGESADLGIIRLHYNAKELATVEIRGRILHSYKSDYTFFGTKTQTSIQNIPQSVSSVTKELIKDKMEFTLKDAVDNASGVTAYSGFDEYTIRGFRAENATDINGLRGYNTTYTSAMLVNIEKVEIIKGPTATLYGNCDPGGTINLVTKKPLDKPEQSINISTGSWHHFRMQEDITGPLNKSKTLLYRLNAGYDKTNSFRNQFYAKSYEASPSLSFIPNNKFQFNFDFSLSHINTIIDRGQPGFENDSTLKSTPINLNVTQPGDYLHETVFASIASLSYKLNAHISFNSGYLNYITEQNVAEHGLQNYITNDSVYLYYSTWQYHTNTNTLTNYFTFKFNTGKLNHQLLAGYDFISSSVNLSQQNWELPDEFGKGSGVVGTFSLLHPQYFMRPVNTYKQGEGDNNNDAIDAAEYHTQGIYIQEQLSMNKWKLFIGIRQEFYKAGDDDNNTDSAEQSDEAIVLPRIGLVYEATQNLSLYATYNKGLDPFEASSAILQVFNQPFKPVTSVLLEAGAKANLCKNKLAATLSVYSLSLQNVAVNANDPSQPDLYVQRGEDRAHGMEAEINGNVSANLSINFSYAYNLAKIIKSEAKNDIGKRKENAPLNISNSWIKYTFSTGMLKRFGITAGHSRVSRRNTLDENIVLPGYLIFDGGFQYSFKHISFAVNINNIANKTYFTSAYNNISKWPGAPRNIMVNIGYSF